MFSPPNVFVHEMISGGGWAAGDLPAELAGEGFSILWALLADFNAWGAVRTLTTLDGRLRARRGELLADEIVEVSPGEHARAFRALLSRADAALIVAPETDGLLAHLSAIACRLGVPLLGCSPRSISLAGNKAACYQLFKRAGLPVPLTRTASYATAPSVAAEMGYPLVVKPIDGVGCEGISLVSSPAELGFALQLARQASRRKQILLQNYVSGNHASVSLLVAREKILPLSLNSQLIEPGMPFHYRGGALPYQHPAARQALELAQTAARLLPGLQGYVGVDLVLAQQGALIIEVNPRITTSYIGLRRVTQANLAELIWNACRDGALPEHVELKGQVAFRKEDPIHLGG